MLFPILIFCNLIILNGPDQLDLFDGFQTNWLEKWEKKSFTKAESTIEVVKDGGNDFLQIASDDSATGIWRDIDFQPSSDAKLNWKWKTKNFIDNPFEMRKKGDDHVGRIYVVFGKYSFLARFRVEVICYVWASEADKDEVFDSPYASNVKLIVLQNNQSENNKWYQESRNVYEDYKRLFDKAPPTISGIGIMADADNTGQSCTTWFDELVLEK